MESVIGSYSIVLDVVIRAECFWSFRCSIEGIRMRKSECCRCKPGDSLVAGKSAVDMIRFE